MPESPSFLWPRRARSFEDTRRAVVEFDRQITPEALRAPLPDASARSRPREDTAPLHSSPSCLQRWWLKTAAKVAAQICSAPGATKGKPARPRELPPPPPPRRWYRIHPTTDMTYYVRPDVGPGFPASSPCSEDCNSPHPNQMAGTPRSGPVTSRMKRTPSLWGELERRVGLIDSLGFESEDLCQICFERPRGVVVLPCRHGGFCGVCLKRTINSRPIHRGGRTCPFCRRFIIEVIKIYSDPVFPGYGYAIKADAYTQ